MNLVFTKIIVGENQSIVSQVSLDFVLHLYTISYGTKGPPVNVYWNVSRQEYSV